MMRHYDGFLAKGYVCVGDSSRVSGQDHSQEWGGFGSEYASACAAAAKVLDDIIGYVKPGVTTRQVDELAAERIKFLRRKKARFWVIASIHVILAFR